MKKLSQLLLFCCLALSGWGYVNAEVTPISEAAPPNPASCYALIYYDSTATGEYQVWVDPIGDGPFTYLWSTGETTQSVTTIPGINYCVTITSASGCTAENCLFGQACYLDVYSDPVLGLQSGSGGIFPISFLWSTGEVQHNILPPTPGEYCVTLTDAVGCTKTKCVFWPSCDANIVIDSSSAAITASVAATGTAPFTYLWNTGETTQTIDGTNLSFNMLCVIVTDANGCVAETCVWGYDCNTYINPNFNTQTLTANAYGAQPLTYLWSNGSTDQTITTLAIGEYCVTVTDFLGCESTSCFSVGNNCGVQAWSQDSIILSGWQIQAYAQGFAPFTYQWDYQGATTQSIEVAVNDQYCVTITDAFGCEASGCTFAIPCYTGIFVENIEANEWELTAQHTGTAPYTYEWSTGETTPEIIVLQSGYYCVTATDAVGCSNFQCYYLNACPVSISADYTASPAVIQAETNLANPSYEWSTGETTPTISPATTGFYCVTVTGNGCSASNCIDFIAPTNFTIFGYVSLEDSTLALPYEGIAELFAYDAANDAWNLAATVQLNNDPDSVFWAATYDFGTWPAGQYLTKATLDPASPYAATYLPTYHYASLLWNEADIITLPNHWWQTPNIIMQDGQNLNGSGGISGLVTEGDGLTANGDGERSGNPRPNTSVLLFDTNEQAVRHTVTNELGEYSFANLTLGTYQVMVEIVGEEQVDRWVSLTAANPISSGNDFEVTPDGIVLGIAEILESGSLQLSPNPTASELNIWLESSVNLEAQISVARLDGTKVLSQRSQLAKGRQRIKLDVEGLPSGLYLVQVASGSGVAAAKFVKN
ncbi:MAG: T9SS type A sorting domain-containing protein [Saprospiraceae bacterium]|nr:T9SS type A sorting domain-containing protein [Saprospiraceae bacterium]